MNVLFLEHLNIYTSFNCVSSYKIHNNYLVSFKIFLKSIEKMTGRFWNSETILKLTYGKMHVLHCKFTLRVLLKVQVIIHEIIFIGKGKKDFALVENGVAPLRSWRRVFSWAEGETSSKWFFWKRDFSLEEEK